MLHLIRIWNRNVLNCHENNALILFYFEARPVYVLDLIFCEINFHKQLLETLLLHTIWNILESFVLLRKDVWRVLGGLGKDVLCGICCVLRRAPVSVGWHWSCAPLVQHRSVHYQGSMQCVCLRTCTPSLPAAGEHSRAIPMQTHFGLV